MRRFTIGRMMLGVGVMAGLLGLYREYGPTVAAVLIWGLLANVLFWWVLGRRPRLAGGSFGLLATGANAGVALIMVYLYSIGGLLLSMLIAAVLIPLVISAGTAWALGRRRRWLVRGALLALVLMAGFGPLVTLATGWPLPVAFALSRPALDRLADRIAAGETLVNPEWAGCYRIITAVRSPLNGNIALVIDAAPAGRSGFVRVVDPASPMLPFVNLNYDLPLGRSWRYQNED